MTRDEAIAAIMAVNHDPALDDAAKVEAIINIIRSWEGDDEDRLCEGQFDGPGPHDPM